MPFIYLLALIGLIVIVIVATVLTETEKFGWATIFLIGGVVIAQFSHMLDLLTFASTHAMATVLYALVYVAVGIVWSFVKWFSFLIMARDRYREWKSQFLFNQGLDPNGQLPEDKQKEFRDFIHMRRNCSYRDIVYNNVYAGKRPQASENKGRIVSWMSLWPCSVIGTLLNDPVRRLFNYLFNSFKALYQRMSDRVFAKDVELQ